MNIFEQRVLGLDAEQASRVELQAARLAEADRPDGAVQYCPVSEAGRYAQHLAGSGEGAAVRIAARLIIAEAAEKLAAKKDEQID